MLDEGPVVMLTHSSRSWAHELHRFLTDHGGALVCGYAVSSESAVEAPYDVLLVDDITSFLSPLLVARLHERGTRVVGMYDPLDGGEAGAELLRSYGVDTVVAIPAVVADLVGTMRDMAPRNGERSPVSDGSDESASDGGVTYPLLAVTGAAEGAGATEVSIAIAAVVAKAAPLVLVDADTQRPAVAQRLGMPVHPNLATAIDHVLHTESPSRSFLQHPDMSCEVIGGIPDASMWQAIRPGELAELLLALRSDRTTLVNIGAALDEIPGGGVPRFGVTRSVLALADEIVLVANADPVGVRRTVDWLGAGRDLVRGTTVHLVLNRCPQGFGVRAQLERELSRSFRFATVTAVAEDRRVTAAAWRGSVSSRGALQRAARRVAAGLEGQVVA